MYLHMNERQERKQIDSAAREKSLHHYYDMILRYTVLVLYKYWRWLLFKKLWTLFEHMNNSPEKIPCFGGQEHEQFYFAHIYF